MRDPNKTAEKGDVLTQVRVKGSPNGKNAVKLLVDKGLVGFIPDTENEEAARCLDAGHKYKGYISNVLPSPHSVGVELRFYVPGADIVDTKVAAVESQVVKKSGCLGSLAVLLIMAAVVILLAVPTLGK